MKRMMAALLCCAMLCGCAASEAVVPEEKVLWVVTEVSNSDGMICQLKDIAADFEKQHEGWTVRLEELPTDAAERELYFKQLRPWIMAGDGPDVYVLPTGSVLTTDYPAVDTQIKIDPLFPDVQQAMRNGVFADVDALYRADEALGTETLRGEIMEAGVLDGARYVLPLRYTMDILNVSDALRERYGLTEELMQSDALTIAQTLLKQEEAELLLAGLILPEDLSLMSPTFDYEKGEICVTQEQIAQYMRVFQAWKSVHEPQVQSMTQYWQNTLYSQYDWPMEDALSLSGPITYADFNRLTEYIWYDLHWLTIGMPLYTDCLADSLQQMPAERILNQEVSVYPLRSMEDKAIAKITYYGAVGSGCENAELAYEFLRQLLTEHFQWDIYRPRVDKDVGIWEIQPDPQRKGMVDGSWPVRQGGMEYLWDNIRYQVYKTYDSWFPKSNVTTKKVQQIRPDSTDTDIAALSLPIDEAVFPVTQPQEEALQAYLAQLNDAAGRPTDADIEELAEQALQALWWQLAEG